MSGNSFPNLDTTDRHHTHNSTLCGGKRKKKIPFVSSNKPGTKATRALSGNMTASLFFKLNKSTECHSMFCSEAHTLCAPQD